MRARDVMTSPVISCHVNDSLNLAAQRMWSADIGALPVVNDEGRLMGMLTDRDIVMAAYREGRPLDELLANGAMSRHVIAALPEDSIGDIEELMARFQVRRIPIVDLEGTPVGMVSMDDLAIESAQPDTPMEDGPAKVAYTLAAICDPRTPYAA